MSGRWVNSQNVHDLKNDRFPVRRAKTGELMGHLKLDVPVWAISDVIELISPRNGDWSTKRSYLTVLDWFVTEDGKFERTAFYFEEIEKMHQFRKFEPPTPTTVLKTVSDCDHDLRAQWCDPKAW